MADAGLDGLVEVDSAGTGDWHEGENADPRALALLEHHGYALAHTARRFEPSWFARLDLVIALDCGHLSTLRLLAPTEEDGAGVRLLRSFDPASPDDLDVPDPSYGGRDDFEECLEMVEEASAGQLSSVCDDVEGQAA